MASPLRRRRRRSSPTPSNSCARATRLGIPALFKSNARNHIDPDARAGINESSGTFSAFPKETGIAAAALGMGDMSPVKDLALVAGEEWRSIGLRGMVRLHGRTSPLSRVGSASTRRSPKTPT